jgi:hypothetical protein
MCTVRVFPLSREVVFPEQKYLTLKMFSRQRYCKKCVSLTKNVLDCVTCYILILFEVLLEYVSLNDWQTELEFLAGDDDLTLSGI